MITRRPSARRTRTRQARLGIMLLEERAVPATFTVNLPGDGLGPGTLRWAVIQANATPAADTIVIRPGTYTLTRSGPGGDGGMTGALEVKGNVTIRGAGVDQTRVVASGLGDSAFHVVSGNVTFAALTIRGGSASSGGGIRVDTGNITINNAALTDNRAIGSNGAGEGGAYAQDAGTLTVNNTVVSGNQALGADGTGMTAAAAGEGGGFFLSDVTARLTRVSFLNNIAIGGRSGTNPAFAGGFAAGGGIRTVGGRLTMSHSTLTGNMAIGGAGQDGQNALNGGEAFGGGIASQTGAVLTLSGNLITSNRAWGGRGGNGELNGVGGDAAGGGVYLAFGGTLSSLADRVLSNLALGGDAGSGGINPPPATGHAGGTGQGGGLYFFIGTNATITNGRIQLNTAQGGVGGNGVYGGNGGGGAGGAFWTASEVGSEARLSISGTFLESNHAVGGLAGTGTTAGGFAGAALGGAGLVGSKITVNATSSHFNDNRAIGATSAKGGAVYVLDANLNLNFVFFNLNQALGGPASFGAGGAITAESGSAVTGTRVSFTNNTALGGVAFANFRGGSGQGGAILLSNSTMSLNSSAFQANQALGAAGVNDLGGNGQGGAIQIFGGSTRIVGSVFNSNRAVGGVAGPGAMSTAGNGLGGAINCDPASALILLSSSVRRNSAVGLVGRGGGLYLTGAGSANLKGSQVTQNTASTDSPNIFGPYTT